MKPEGHNALAKSQIVVISQAKKGNGIPNRANHIKERAVEEIKKEEYSEPYNKGLFQL